MKDFEILQLIESKGLPTRSYRVPEKLMDALRREGETIFGKDVDGSKLLFYFAAYGVMTWKERQRNPQAEGPLETVDVDQGTALPPRSRQQGGEHKKGRAA